MPNRSLQESLFGEGSASPNLNWDRQRLLALLLSKVMIICRKGGSKSRVIEEKQRKEGKAALPEESSDVSHSSSYFPCMDKLREKLSFAICLKICFEPSTTPCGRSFCKKCLRSAADKCGKRCLKCRQLISNG